jgi:16S rRNA (guanine527-N7)-methyltransferase
LDVSRETTSGARLDPVVSRETSLPEVSASYAALMQESTPPSAPDRARVVARWAGLELTDPAWDALDRYAAWLTSEAVAAGGIGPAEAGRVWERHIADALAFAAPLPFEPSGRLVDVGSGVGLPGIPLAVALPGVHVVLVDRSERRADLARRATRVMGLPNVEVIRAEAQELDVGWDFVTMRAVATIERAAVLARRLLRRGGIGVVALSRVVEPRHEQVAALGADVAVLTIPPDVLDSAGWLLTIRP